MFENLKYNISDFFEKNKDKILLTLVCFLIAATSFAAGRLSISLKSKPVAIKMGKEAKETEGEVLGEKETLFKDQIEDEYVGDASTGLYYASTSKSVKKIKESDLIWFSTKEEAEDEGFSFVESSDKKTTEGETKEDKAGSNDEKTEKGKYVGSINSDLYHLPNSSAAKRIKKENQVWFESEEEALDQGYKPGPSVKKAKEEN